MVLWLLKFCFILIQLLCVSYIRNCKPKEEKIGSDSHSYYFAQIKLHEVSLVSHSFIYTDY